MAPPPAKFKESIVLGEHLGSANDVSRVVKELRELFAPGTYDLLEKNCNTFSQAFCDRLIGVEIPRWVNRLANTGGFFAKMGINLKAAVEPAAAGSTATGSPASTKVPGAKSSTAKKELTETQRALLSKMKPKSASASET